MLYPALTDWQTQPEMNCFNTQSMHDCNTKIEQYSNQFTIMSVVQHKTYFTVVCIYFYHLI